MNLDFEHKLAFFETRLTPETAPLAQSYPCVCCFVSDQLNAETLILLAKFEVKLIAANRLGIRVVRAPLTPETKHMINSTALSQMKKVLARILTFPNVLVTSHQAFLTREALTNIAKTTFQNITDFQDASYLRNEVRAESYLARHEILPTAPPK